MSGIGNDVQIREIVEQVAEAAVRRHALENPPSVPKAEIPAPLKWAAAIVSGLLSVGIAGICLWVVTSLSTVQQTVAVIAERQQMTGATITQRLDKMDDRLTRLEHAGGGKGQAE